MLFEVLGDMWVIVRNPYIQDDLLENRDRRELLIGACTIASPRSRRAPRQQPADPATRGARTRGRGPPSARRRTFRAQEQLRRAVRQRLARVTHRDNIDFSGLARVSHVTDATDWRVEFPLVVITPDSEAEVRDVVAACIELGLTIIARGGGTGYTGGAVPLYQDTAVINTEKLDALGAVEQRKLEGVAEAVPTVRAEAGVITLQVTKRAESQGLSFAVDPDLAGCLHHRRQHRHECRRQEGGAVGHDAR